VHFGIVQPARLLNPPVSHNGHTGTYAVSRRISKLFVSSRMTYLYQFATDYVV